MHAQSRRLLSGVKPTGRPHVGNFLGAMKQFVEFQNDYESFVMIADYHALTTVHESEKIHADTLGVALDYLAIGLDPKNVTLFKQSDVPAHVECGWVFSCITNFSYLKRAHAYKDAEAKGAEISGGTVMYPMLMAADILLYDPDIVPVGQDQKQHLEFARDTAEKFNGLFGETFKLPEPIIHEEVATVPGLDGRKMSKSYSNTIPLFAEDEEIEKLVMSVPTDSKGVAEPKDTESSVLFKLHTLFSSGDRQADVKKRYREGGIGYKESKEILTADIKTLIAPLRERRKELEKDMERVLDILAEGARRANEVAEAKMERIREAVGVR